MWGGLRSGSHTHTHTQTDEAVSTPATGTLILSQSNNAAAGTNSELFNSHQLMLRHQVLLCAFPILILCISRILFAFTFIVQVLENRRDGGSRGGRGVNDIYAQRLEWLGLKRAVDIKVKTYGLLLFPFLRLVRRGKHRGLTMSSGAGAHTLMRMPPGVCVCRSVCFSPRLCACVSVSV